MSSPPDGELLFHGHDGTESSERFVSRVMHHAFSNGKMRDFMWMADLAATGMRGEAMRWWMDLDDEVQLDWKKLRKAMLERYPHNSAVQAPVSVTAIPTPAAAPPPTVTIPSDSTLPLRSSSPNVLTPSSREASPASSGRIPGGPSAAWSVIRKDSSDIASPIKDHRASSPRIDGLPASKNEKIFKSLTPSPWKRTLPPAGRIPIESWNPIAAPPFLPRTEGAWLNEARKRRIAYLRGDATVSSVHWILIEHSDPIPKDAIPTGLDHDGSVLFCARGWIGGGLTPGKCGPSLNAGAILTYVGKEIHDIKPFEVLVGIPSAVRWIGNPWTHPIESVRGNTLQISMKPFEAIEGGIDAGGTPFLLIQAFSEGKGWQVGKVGVGHETADYGWYFGSVSAKEFRILVWAD